MRFSFRRSLRVGATALLAGLMPMTAGALAGVTHAQATAGPAVLLYGPSLTGGTSSLEYQAAVLAGYTPTIVDQAGWDAMTTSQFEAYRGLVIGDPTCGDNSADLAATVGQWGPAVTHTASNRVIIGTDPVFHNGAHPGNIHLINGGVDFAGRVVGATGLYLDLSCSGSFGDSANDNTITNGLEAAGGTPFAWEASPCSGNEAVVAQTGPTASVTDADMSNWFCSSHEDAQTWPADWTPAVISTDAPTKNYCANDVGGGGAGFVCGGPYVLIHGSGVTVSGDITLSPKTALNFTDESHTLTAHVVQDGSPASGITVTFSVIDGPNKGTTGTGVTNSSGDATFTYSDTSGKAGTDTIVASFTDSSGALHQSSQVTKTWRTFGCYNFTKSGNTDTFFVRDTTGLQSIVFDKLVNATGAADAFTPGTTSPVRVVVTKTDTTKTAQFLAHGTDASGKHYCSSGLISF